MPYSPLELADAFIRTGELADALETLNKHLMSNPADDSARRLRAAVLMRMPGEHNPRAALADFDQLTQVTADDEVQRSIAYQAAGDWSQANTAMERAHRLRPQDERITERYVNTLEMSGKLDEARRLVATLPPTWRWLQIAGDLANHAGEAQVAREHYEAAIRHLETRMDTFHNPVAANLKQILVLKRDSLPA
jgi:tetratricopeptide (TPR) repeat protein